jgi:hypothetical protein
MNDKKRENQKCAVRSEYGRSKPVSIKLDRHVNRIQNT